MLLFVLPYFLCWTGYRKYQNKIVTYIAKTNYMPRYVIERELPGAGKLSQDELKAISQKSMGVIGELGPQIQWVESFVTEDKIYCVYNAPSKELIMEHAAKGGFPANRIEQVRNVISPITAE
jgi:hypothetical protein